MLVIAASGCSADATTLPGLTLDDGCSDGESADAGPDQGADAAPEGCDPSGEKVVSRRYVPPPCLDGQTRSCQIILGEHNGVVDCMPGVNRCVAGAWAEECTTEGEPGSL